MPADRIPIARFSAITRISQRALRYYDRLEILVPEARDPFTGYRYYTSSQMELGVKIGAGSREPSVSPGGRSTPQIAPERW